MNFWNRLTWFQDKISNQKFQPVLGGNSRFIGGWPLGRLRPANQPIRDKLAVKHEMPTGGYNGHFCYGLHMRTATGRSWPLDPPMGEYTSSRDITKMAAP